MKELLERLRAEKDGFVREEILGMLAALRSDKKGKC